MEEIDEIINYFKNKKESLIFENHKNLKEEVQNENNSYNKLVYFLAVGTILVNFFITIMVLVLDFIKENDTLFIIGMIIFSILIYFTIFYVLPHKKIFNRKTQENLNEPFKKERKRIIQKVQNIINNLYIIKIRFAEKLTLKEKENIINQINKPINIYLSFLEVTIKNFE